MRRISTDLAQPGMVTGKPVFGFSGQVLLNSGVAIKPQHIFYLKQIGIKTLYICDQRMGDVNIKDTLSDELRNESRVLVSQIIKNVDSPSANNKGINIKDQEIINLVERIIDEIVANKDIVVQLADIRSIDGYLFAHSVNCAVITTLMAAKLNYNREELKEIALGAILHDMGMVAVPPAVINKKGELTSDEFEMVIQHPSYGFELFKKFPLYSPEAGKIILQHHERYRGQGYPKGLGNGAISDAAHLLAIADVFDALTSDKPNRKAYRTHQAIEMLMSWGGDYFHLDYLRHFLSNIAAYPAGTHVFLSNGESGFVIANTPGYALRPVVRIIYKGEDMALHPNPYDLDLTGALDLAVVKVIEVPTSELH
jgi:HD-GYP domain-containing protein (c-di-GMP phosphodiesterase class II)